MVVYTALLRRGGLGLGRGGLGLGRRRRIRCRLLGRRRLIRRRLLGRRLLRRRVGLSRRSRRDHVLPLLLRRSAWVSKASESLTCAGLTAPRLSQVPERLEPKLTSQKRVEAAGAEVSCGALQERHFAHAGVTSQESLLGALEPLLVALPLPALRALLHHLLLADDERCTGTRGDGACKRQ